MNIWLVEIWRAWRASLRRPGFLLLATSVLALGVSRLLASMSMSMSLLGQGPSVDPLATGGVCVVLTMAGLLACVIPAVRAGRVQPMRALRGE